MRCHDPAAGPGRAASRVTTRHTARRVPTWHAARRLTTLAVAVAVVLVGCNPAPPSLAPSPTGPPPTAVATAPAGSGVPAAEPALAAALRDAVDPAAILDDLQRLEDFASANEGNRAAGSRSEAEAGAVRRRRAPGSRASTSSSQDVDPAVVQPGRARACSRSTTARAGRSRTSTTSRPCSCRRAATFAGRSTRWASIRPRQPGDRSGLGLSAGRLGGRPGRAIVLVQPGPCFRRDVVVNAQDGGRRRHRHGLPGVPARHRPPADAHRPGRRSRSRRSAAIERCRAGAAGRGAAGGGRSTSSSQTTVEDRTSINVIAETAGGADDHVLIIGGHIDSVVDGPGINDNGSGTMTILEIARQLAAAPTGPQSQAGDGWKVRIAFWTGRGDRPPRVRRLRAGRWIRRRSARSRRTSTSTCSARRTASGEVYDGAQTTRPTESGAVAGLFAAAFDRVGLSSASQATLGGAATTHRSTRLRDPDGRPVLRRQRDQDGRAGDALRRNGRQPRPIPATTSPATRPTTSIPCGSRRWRAPRPGWWARWRRAR